MSTATLPAVAGNGRFPSDLQGLLADASQLAEKLAEEKTAARFASIEVPMPAGWQPSGWKSLLPLEVRRLEKDVAMALVLHWNNRKMLSSMDSQDWAVAVPYNFGRYGVLLVDVAGWRPLNAIDLPPQATEAGSRCSIYRRVKKANKRRLAEGNLTAWNVTIAQPYLVNCVRPH